MCYRSYLLTHGIYPRTYTCTFGTPMDICKAIRVDAKNGKHHGKSNVQSLCRLRERKNKICVLILCRNHHLRPMIYDGSDARFEFGHERIWESYYYYPCVCVRSLCNDNIFLFSGQIKISQSYSLSLSPY